MFGLSVSHLLIVLVVLLLFGARRLPELAGAMGKSLNAFKKGMESGADDSQKTAAQQIEDDNASKS